MEYIHYGDQQFRQDKFAVIKNQIWNKPCGGLWASPIGAKRGWKDWCDDEQFGSYSEDECFQFTLSQDAKVLHIRSHQDLEDLPRNKEASKYVIGTCDTYLDFEFLLTMGYDAIELHLSEDKHDSFDKGLYWRLYGWDCDCILIMNPNIIVTK